MAAFEPKWLIQNTFIMQTTDRIEIKNEREFMKFGE